MSDPNQVTRFKILKATTANRLAFTPLEAEMVQDTDTKILYIGDGITPGGVLAAPLAANTNKVILIVRNETGAMIPKGTPVFIDSATPGGLPLIGVAMANNIATLPVFSVMESDISNNSTGTSVLIGEIGGLDTSSFSDGDNIYLGPTGGFVNAPPPEPNAVQVVGQIGHSDLLTGTIIVSIKPTLRFQNMLGNHVPIGQTGGNTTTVDIDTKISANTSVAAATSHIANTSNPHGVTKAQVGLSNVPNLDTSTTTNVTEGSNLYFTAARVLATALTGLSLVTGTAITAADTVLSAMGKIQKQITDIISGFSASVLSTVLTGLSLSTGGVISATDSVLVAFGKLQNQITALPGSSDVYLKTTTTQSSVSTTPAAITELTTASLAVGTYYWKVVGLFQSTSTAIGIGFRINAIGATMGFCIGKWRIPQNANGVNSNYEYDQLTPTTDITTPNCDAANTDFVVEGNGTFSVTVAGTVAVQFRSETGTSVSIRANSILMLKKIS